MPQYYRILDNGQGFNQAESKRQRAMKPKAKPKPKKGGSFMENAVKTRQRNASKAASGIVPAKGRGGVDSAYVGWAIYNAKQRKKAQGKKK